MPYPDGIYTIPDAPELSAHADSDVAALQALRSRLIALLNDVDAMHPDTAEGDDAQGDISALIHEAVNRCGTAIERIAETEGVRV